MNCSRELTFIRQLGSDLAAFTHQTRHFEYFLALCYDLLQLGIGHFDCALRLNSMDPLANGVVLAVQLVQFPELGFAIDGENVTGIGRKPSDEVTVRRQFICELK